MQWFLALTAAVAAFLLLALAVGWMLPEEHTATLGARVRGSPPEVWEAITDAGRFHEWRPGVEEVEVLETDADGPRRWTERGTVGSLTFEITERRPDEALALRIAGEEVPFGGTWTIELQPETGGATRVRITEEGEIRNPVFRFLARFALGYRARMRDYLEGLERRMAGDGSAGSGGG